MNNTKPSQIKKAVALKYPEGAVAPIIVAKGNGILAEKIVEEAEKNQIVIEENPMVVNLLKNNNAGDIIPEEAWQAVAVIFSYIMERK
ncbi:MAG: EscU/YscU/HrcU family type III secretion system export apparatus switch protein [Treponema sp.]|nr:EscU/YscU/HrcU family type III secretion system export apparatus switch protein [Treponema sp.]